MITKNEKIIIDELKNDSRASIKDISKRTSIKPSTVYQTITRLRDKKVIEKFTIKVNDKLMSRDFIVFMFVLTSEDIERNFFKNQFVEEVHGITGEYDLLLKLKFKDVAEFNEFIIEFRKNKNVVKTLTMVGTTVIKE